MYSIIFAILLLLIFGFKTFKLVTNRKRNTSFAEIDTYVGQVMNEGEQYEK